MSTAPIRAGSMSAVIKPLSENLLARPGYNPENMLDALLTRANLKNDAALARYLQVTPPAISKARSRKLEVSAALLLRIHDRTGIALNELRAWMGVEPVELA